MSKLAPFRVGDIVRVDTPLVVARVGYPKCVDDYVQELKGNAWLTAALQHTFTCSGVPYTDERRWDAVIRELAKAKAVRERFGGNERTIHTREEPRWKDKHGRVSQVRYCKTGTYQRERDWGEDGYDPPELRDVKTHRILVLWLVYQVQGHWEDDLYPADFAVEIESVHVTKIEGAPELTKNAPCPEFWA